jgi:hypothetical protein
LSTSPTEEIADSRCRRRLVLTISPMAFGDALVIIPADIFTAP